MNKIKEILSFAKNEVNETTIIYVSYCIKNGKMIVDFEGDGITSNGIKSINLKYNFINIGDEAHNFTDAELEEMFITAYVDWL